MTDAINSNNRIKAPSQPPEQRARNAGTAAKSTGNTPAEPASAVVNLSSSKLMEQISNLPEIDSGRVESIKNAIANGEYKPDPEVIARKFAAIENLLP